MNVTLETPPAEIRPEEPVLAAEAATDVQPAESLSQTPDTEVSVEPAPSETSEIDTQSTAERHKLRERIQKSSSLSRGMRDRLTALLEGESAPAGLPDPLIRAADALALLEEAIPPQLRLDPQALAQPEHPAGEVFFTGDVNQMTDDLAERLAREQLALSPWAKQG